MKFHLASASGNVFTAYGRGFVEINRQRYQKNVVVTPERIEEDWVPPAFDALTGQDFARLIPYQPEVVLLGTGDRIRFPHPSLTVALISARIGLEVMDVSAACRTFNILSAEGRRVLAVVLFDGSTSASP